jgi:predicted ribosome quality control (RQC) complex YloA/Tae2 family protein
METLTCIALARELNSMLRDTYVHAVEGADAGETLLLHMKVKAGSGKRTGWIVLSACGGVPFLFYSYRKPEIEGRRWPTPLAESLDRLLVRSVSHRGMDRSMKITFAAARDRGGRREMVLELFAAKPRAYLIDPGTGEVLASFNANAKKKAAVYTPPAAPAGKIDPMELDAEALSVKLSSGATQSDLMTQLLGVGRLLAREVLERAGKSGGAANSLVKLLSAVTEGRTRGFVAGPSKELGLKMPAALAFRPSAGDETRIEECPTVNDALRKCFIACRAEQEQSGEIRRAAQRIRADLKRLGRTVAALEGELSEAERAGELRRAGELILSNMAEIPKGAAEMELLDHEVEGRPRRVTLDPRISPAKNAAAYFKKARKLEKKCGVIPGRIAELDAQAQALQQELEDVESGRVAPRPGGRPSGDGSPLKKKKWPVGVSPRRFTSSDGWTIYVGRNNKENEYITFAYARPNDFWFHAHGVPGSHVVLRREGRKANPSKRCIEETAAAAAYFSKGRTSGTVAVIYTEKRYVRKPRKGPAGTALYSHEQTVMVAPALPKEEDE